jgi:hypothetical protein
MELFVFREFVFLSSCLDLTLFNSMFTEKFVKALIFLNIHDVFLSICRNLLLLNGHLDSKLSLHFLLLHQDTVLNSFFFGEGALRSFRS